MAKRSILRIGRLPGEKVWAVWIRTINASLPPGHPEKYGEWRQYTRPYDKPGKALGQIPASFNKHKPGMDNIYRNDRGTLEIIIVEYES